MYKLDEIKMQKFFEEHGITQFNVTHVEKGESGREFSIVVRPTQELSLAEYLLIKMPKMLKFKNFTEIYEVIRFIINHEGKCSKVYVLKKGEQILDVFSVYELRNADQFIFNDYINLNIDEIIKEV